MLLCVPAAPKVGGGEGEGRREGREERREGRSDGGVEIAE